MIRFMSNAFTLAGREKKSQLLFVALFAITPPLASAIFFMFFFFSNSIFFPKARLLCARTETQTAVKMSVQNCKKHTTEFNQKSQVFVIKNSTNHYNPNEKRAKERKKRSCILEMDFPLIFYMRPFSQRNVKQRF